MPNIVVVGGLTKSQRVIYFYFLVAFRIEFLFIRPCSNFYEKFFLLRIFFMPGHRGCCAWPKGQAATSAPNSGREKFWRPARGVENASLSDSRFLFAYTFVFATLILRACLITSFTRCAAFVRFFTGHPECCLFSWRSFGFAEHVFWYNSLAN